jgi:hypothetical protein
VNPITWLRWRSRVPALKGGPVAQMAELVAWRETKDHDRWRSLFPSLRLPAHPERRLRLWVVDAAIWQHSRLTRRVSPDLLDQFFSAFWPVFLREATEDTSVPMTAEQLSEHVGLFLPTIADPSGWEGRPDKYPWYLGKAAWAYVGDSEPPRESSAVVPLSIMLPTQLISCAQLLDDLPSIADRTGSATGA